MTVSQDRMAHAWESYERTSRLYHVTSFDNYLSIRVGGLISKTTVDDNGVMRPAIWLFTDKKWAASVANSIGLTEFALLSMKKSSIKRDLIRWDNVGETCAAVSFYCLKERIDASRLSLLGVYSLGKPNAQALAA